LVLRGKKEDVVSSRPILGEAFIEAFVEEELEFGGLASVDFYTDGLVDSHYPTVGLLVFNRDLFACFGAAAGFEGIRCRVHATVFFLDNLNETSRVNKGT